MAEHKTVNARYCYLHDHRQGINIHHIVVQKSILNGFLICLWILFFSANIGSLLLVKDSSVTTLLWSFLLGAVLFKLLLWNAVVKESVVVIPTFGVQLETHYRSGRINRRFVPIDMILKPVLNEVVTPVTCYWSLSMIVRGEETLMLVFKKSRPPVKMLIPIWKALCAVSNGVEGS